MFSPGLIMTEDLTPVIENQSKRRKTVTKKQKTEPLQAPGFWFIHLINKAFLGFPILSSWHYP